MPKSDRVPIVRRGVTEGQKRFKVRHRIGECRERWSGQKFRAARCNECLGPRITFLALDSRQHRARESLRKRRIVAGDDPRHDSPGVVAIGRGSSVQAGQPEGGQLPAANGRRLRRPGPVECGPPRPAHRLRRLLRRRESGTRTPECGDAAARTRDLPPVARFAPMMGSAGSVEFARATSSPGRFPLLDDLSSVRHRESALPRPTAPIHTPRQRATPYRRLFRFPMRQPLRLAIRLRLLMSLPVGPREPETDCRPGRNRAIPSRRACLLRTRVPRLPRDLD